MAGNAIRRINGPAFVAFQQMDADLQRDILAYLDDRPRDQCFTSEDLVRAYLTWNGIINYTATIVRLVLQSHKE